MTPTVWTIHWEFIPYRTDLLYRKFGVGLGINSMQGREAKHVRISQYAKHATLSTWWNLVFRHDSITTVWLRKQDPTSFTYHKNSEVCVPKCLLLWFRQGMQSWEMFIVFISIIPEHRKECWSRGLRPIYLQSIKCHKLVYMLGQTMKRKQRVLVMHILKSSHI